MALERNNTALELEPDYDPQFGHMLRRHLKHGGAPVAACTGFDADTASAFLESALPPLARTQYESHLAGCPGCRRHIIELSRLMRSVPQLEPARQTPPVWAKWKTAITEWFDASRWNWNWQTAGLTGAAAMALIAALTMQPWRQSYNASKSDMAMAPAAEQRADANPSSGIAPAQPLTAAVPEDIQESERRESNESTALSRSASTLQSPNPLASKLEVTPGSEPRDAVSSFSPQSPQASRIADEQQPRERIAQLPSASTAAAPQLAGQTSVAFVQPDIARKEIAEAQQPGGSLVGMQVAPSPDDNPMRVEKDKSSAKKADDSGVKQDFWKRVSAFAPRRKADGESKITPILRDDEEVRPLTVRIHNRVFYRQNGAWVDQEYKDDLMNWRVTKLVYGSPEFERVLADDPQLKPYFEKRRILVIWRDKIYKIVEK